MKKYGILIERDNYLKFNIELVAVNDDDELVHIEMLDRGRPFASAMRIAREGLDKLSLRITRGFVNFTDPPERKIRVE
jgi:hypothetical protein